jgi:osmotically-inducible protein OsmY
MALPAEGPGDQAGGMSNNERKTDHQLKSAITAELNWTPNVKADRIGVAVNDGAITLSGQVETYPEKMAAVKAALRVGGVDAVADEIVVHHTWSDPSDADVAREAAIALERTVTVPSATVKAEVHDHVVSLTGTVGWHFQREAARRAVLGLPGVNGVISTIAIKPTQVISGSEARAGITAAIVRQAQQDASRVEVTVVGSEIRLTGTVSSWAERNQAENAAWSARGVTHIDNQLQVNAFVSP